MLWLLARGLCLGLLVVLLLAFQPAPDPTAAKIAGLIQQLGDDDFDTREAASAELAELGEKALPALRKAAAVSRDAEIRRRAQTLLGEIILSAAVSKSTGLKLMPLDGGEFFMGSPGNESNRRPDETRHVVQLTRPFLLGVYEVRQDEYKKVMGVEPSWFNGPARAGGQNTASFPVERVSWFDAVEFCNRLSKLDGYEPYYRLADVQREGDTIKNATVTMLGGNGYRLPTEAEWEYGCRAGKNTAYHFGNENSGREANLKPGPPIGYGGGPSWPTLNRPAPVGSYPPNELGLYEVHGNVAEWCHDWYDRDFYNTPAAGTDPTGPDKGVHRVVRGGSWMINEGGCRSASRFWLIPGEATNYAGFRVARTP